MKNINYKTIVKVDMIKIVNENGDTLYHLPVGSNYITIGKSLLESGSYSFLFLRDGNVKRTTTVVVK